ncbi:hypothetical protein AB0M29_27825 [Streptomyces sp. NPDC051976]|uniref:hypothetical protein n=1 Tax=Streptomyces sp. NPDC051976 TaxID=3154947 RepID=UPI003423AE3A
MNAVEGRTRRRHAAPAPDPYTLRAPVTIAVLPGGTVHTVGTVISHSSDLRDAAHPAWSQAAWRARRMGCLVPVAVGHPDGRVDAYDVGVDGSPVLRSARLGPHRRLPDPNWGDVLPDGHAHGLMDAVRAAEEAGRLVAARTVTGHPLAPEDCHGHPRTVLGVELEAEIAVRSHRWELAAYLYTAAAVVRYRGSGSAEAADQILQQAVTVWLRTSPGPAAGSLGFPLAHLLIATAPGRPGPIAAVLRRLADQLPAASHRPS